MRDVYIADARSKIQFGKERNGNGRSEKGQGRKTWGTTKERTAEITVKDRRIF